MPKEPLNVCLDVSGSVTALGDRYYKRVMALLQAVELTHDVTVYPVTTPHTSKAMTIAELGRYLGGERFAGQSPAGGGEFLATQQLRMRENGSHPEIKILHSPQLPGTGRTLYITDVEHQNPETIAALSAALPDAKKPHIVLGMCTDPRGPLLPIKNGMSLGYEMSTDLPTIVSTLDKVLAGKHPYMKAAGVYYPTTLKGFTPHAPASPTEAVRPEPVLDI